MADRPDNPPAFPTDGRIQHGTAYDGMSLRDWFAGQIAGGAAACFRDIGVRAGESKAEAFANWVGERADAMLAERAKADAS